MTDLYRRPAISNGNPEGCYVDAIWFPEVPNRGEECPGLGAPAKYPIAGVAIILCEAKGVLTPELIGQALVYAVFARNADAHLRQVVIFAARGRNALHAAAKSLGLEVILRAEAK